MDTVSLPAGYTSRAPGLDDAEQILELVVAHNTPIVGFGDFTLDDVRDELTEPGFDPATDGWLVIAPDGTVAGYGWAMGQPGDADLVDIDAVAPDRQVAHWLLDRALRRARELGRARGHEQVTIDKTIYRGDTAMADLAGGLGFAPATTFHRMRIDHTGPVPMPAPPPGVLVHEGAYDDAIRRAAHHVSMASFSDHFGHHDLTYADWVDLHEKRSVFDWSQLTVIEADGTPVAICECNDSFVEDENCGYVARVGVLEEARGRGLATYLLRRTFAADATAGRAGTLLHVDTNNTTPALGLYESVGMRPALVLDVWRLVALLDGAA